RDRDDLGKRVPAAPRLDQWQHPALGPDTIGLVQHAEDRPRVGSQRVEHDRVWALAGRGVDDEADQVDVLHGALRGLQHEIAELAVGRVEAGRIDEDHLGAWQILDAGDAVSRGLGATRDDRELLADQPDQERRFPGVRSADERHEPGAAGHWSGCLEAGLDRGGPETGAAMLGTPGGFGWRSRLGLSI